MAAFRLLICDLDNTLYDWVTYFVTSFYAMAGTAAALTGCNQDKLLDDFRKVHQKYHDCEHPFALLETETVTELFPGRTRAQIATALRPALEAFNSSREVTLRLHPDVNKTLSALQSHGIKIVAHSESKFHAVVDRLERLNLAKYFARIYCQERVSIEHPFADQRRVRDIEHDAKIIELSHHQRKPDTSVVTEICSDLNIELAETAYIGDSVAKDVLMAKEAGVFAIWARYGAQHDPKIYEKLVRISHWTPEDVEREKKLARIGASVKPDFIAAHSFGEILRPLRVFG